MNFEAPFLKTILLSLSLSVSFLHGRAQDEIRVQFIYGSKPHHAYKSTEPKWLGGILGGHVGIEGCDHHFLSFEGKGKFHYFNHKNNPNSIYKDLND